MMRRRWAVALILPARPAAGLPAVASPIGHYRTRRDARANLGRQAAVPVVAAALTESGARLEVRWTDRAGFIVGRSRRG